MHAHRPPRHAGPSSMDLAWYFGEPRQQGTSHAVFRTPWPGDPRVNIQNHKGKAKPYQVRQVLKAIDTKEAQ
ncbi:MAG: toxin HicA [Actinophytocola sp.]|nr:toxin HicA [Actinophytocola sp.]